MPETLEIRLGGHLDGRSIAPRDLDYSEVGPIISALEAAALVEAGLQPGARGGRLKKGHLRPLRQVNIALTGVRDSVEDLDTTTTKLSVVFEFFVGNDTAPAISKITHGLAGDQKDSPGSGSSGESSLLSRSHHPPWACGTTG